MKSEQQIRDRLAEVEGDKRLTEYKPAVVEIDAPLALMQMGLATTSLLLRWILDEHPVTWPRKKPPLN